MTSARSIHRHILIVGGRAPAMTWFSKTSSSAICMCGGNELGAITSHLSSSKALPVFLKVMSRRRTLWTLYAINFLNAAGMWFFLPLLPIFLGRKGGSAALVGVVFAAGLAANALLRDPSRPGRGDALHGRAVSRVSASAANRGVRPRAPPARRGAGCVLA